MPSQHLLFLFFTSALVLLITPGPAVIFVVTRGVQHGRAPALASTLGLNVGAIVHAVAAILGLSAILTSSAFTFHAVKLAGAAYLIYLGVKALRSRRMALDDAAAAPLPLRRHFLDGLVVNLLNPKPAIFFLAFLPQFVDPAAGPIQAQLALLGAIFVAMALVTDGAYALAAASSRSWLLRQPKLLRWEPFVSGAVYLGLGAWAALSGRKAS